MQKPQFRFPHQEEMIMSHQNKKGAGPTKEKKQTTNAIRGGGNRRKEKTINSQYDIRTVTLQETTRF